MAEMVTSAVVGEAVSRISTVLIDKPNKRSRERDNNMERLEMAHIKMEAALHMSGRWQIMDVPMLRWRSKLKRAAQECDDTLRRCKQRALEDEERRQSSSFTGRIARAAISFMSSFSIGADSTSSDTVRRFERFAKGTSDFLNLVEFGWRRYTFFNPLIGNLLMGKTLHYQALRGGKFYLLLVRPMSFAERGVEAMVSIICHELEDPAKSFRLRLIMRLSESSDVFGIIINCMKSMAAVPHFMAAAENVRRLLIELPSQDFSWVAHSQRIVEDSINPYCTLTQWFRPDPFCCNHHYSAKYSTSTAAPMYPEEVIAVYLQCCISPADEHQNCRSSASENSRRSRSSTNSGSAPLKLGILSIHHFFPEGIDPACEGRVYVVDGNGQRIVHTNACLQDVNKEVLPMAIEHLCENSEFRMYLRPRHGSAYLCMEKMRTHMPSRRGWIKRVDQCRKKSPVTMKLGEAFRGLARENGKEQMDTTAFCFFSAAAFSFFSAAIEQEQHCV